MEVVGGCDSMREGSLERKSLQDKEILPAGLEDPQDSPCFSGVKAPRALQKAVHYSKSTGSQDDATDPDLGRLIEALAGVASTCSGGNPGPRGDQPLMIGRPLCPWTIYPPVSSNCKTCVGK